MAFIYYNANPSNRDTIDCVIRGMTVLLGRSWNDVHRLLTDKAAKEHEVYIKNDFWIDVLLDLGYEIHYIPNTCPDCITVRRFADHHPHGKYLLGTGSHVIAIEDGNYIDTWDSGDELPIYYFVKRKEYL